MRTSLSSKARALDIFGIRGVAAGTPGPDDVLEVRPTRLETALEVQFRSIESLLQAMDNLAGRGARARRRRRRRPGR